jgi:hypothetical protein
MFILKKKKSNYVLLPEGQHSYLDHLARGEFRQDTKQNSEKYSLLRIVKFARHQWLTPVILATWEAEMERIKVRGQRG